MKASELRIGNYVTLYGDDCRIQTLGQWVHTETTVDEAPIESVKPILLSEEWLERFGCVKRGHSYWETPNGVPFNFSADNHCGLITFGPRHVNFWHVHTFQNIISLTGEELTLKEQ